MNLILVRHAEAVNIGQAGATTDFDRPLSELGRKQAAALAVGLRAVGVAPGSVASSPLVRAVQTAEPLLALLHDRHGAPAVCGFLAPDDYKPKRLAEYAAGSGAGPVVLVGHNPSISDFACWLLNAERGGIDLDKGAAALFECPNGPGKGEGELRWLVSPEWYLR